MSRIRRDRPRRSVFAVSVPSEGEIIEGRSYEALGAHEVIRALCARCQTHRARARGSVSEWLASDREACERTWQRVEQLLFNRDREKTRLPSLRDGRVEAMILESNRTILEIDELTLARNAGEEMATLFAAYREYFDDQEVRLAFATVKDGLEEKDDALRVSGLAFPGVAQARREVRDAERAVASAARTAAKSIPNAEGDFFELDGRLVIALPFSQRKQYLVHGVSRSGQTAYVEPAAMVEPVNERRAARSRLRAEEAKALREMTRSLRAHASLIDQAIEQAAVFDADSARATLGSEAWNGVVPLLSTESIIDCDGLSYALLSLNGETRIVRNEIALKHSSQAAVIISGANAGGKTVFMKSVGLAAVLTRMAVPIPAERATIGFFTTVLADVGDSQQLGQSTYVGHLRFVKHALEKKNENALILLDELGSGTEPSLGAALGRASLEALVDTGALLIATTHHAALKEQLALSDHRFRTAAMGQLPDNAGPSYKALYGMVGESRALEAARSVGLPVSLLKRAESLVGNDLLELEFLRTELRQAQTKAIQDAERAADLADQAKEAKKKAKKALAEANQMAADAKAEAALEYERKLVGLTKELERKAQTQVLEKSQVIAEQKQAELDTARLSANAMGLEPLSSLDPLVPGEAIVVLKPGPWFGRLAVIKSIAVKTATSVLQGVDPFAVKPIKLKPHQIAIAPDDLVAQRKVSLTGGDSNNAARNANGSVLSRRAAKALAQEDVVSTSASLKAPAKKYAASKNAAPDMRTSRNTLDLRGATLADAEIDTDVFIDRVFREHFNTAFILHGHGTGVLKKGIRSYLKRHPRVKSALPANHEDGGDAFTTLTLRR